MKSDYSFIVADEVLCIADNDGSKSVTNNTENVLNEIKESLNAGGLRMPDTVIYKDTEGNWDGIEYDGSNATFYLLHTRSLTEAIDLAKKRK